MVRFIGLNPASNGSSRAAAGSSRKKDTAPELLLRSALRRAGLRSFRVDQADLPGRPDVVFRAPRIAIFCDGDFWHGRDLELRLAKLARGHNAAYWVAKIQGNVARDRRRDAELAEMGWMVLRFWESSIKEYPDKIAAGIATLVRSRSRPNKRRVRLVQPRST